MEMDLTVFTAMIVPLIVGLVQVAKGIGVSDRFAPIASIGLGLGLTALGALTGNVVENDGSRADAFMIVVTGTLAGLSASGLYSGARAVTHSTQP